MTIDDIFQLLAIPLALLCLIASAMLLPMMVGNSYASTDTFKREESSTKSSAKPPLVLRMLALVIISDAEREYIIGDLLEEYEKFPSKLEGRFWLYKQVMKSIYPLIYKTIKSRLASLFGERIR